MEASLRGETGVGRNAQFSVRVVARFAGMFG